VRITYDRRTDTLSLVLKEGVAIAESDEGKPGVILDYDASGDLVSLEVLDASRRVTEADRVEYQTTIGNGTRTVGARSLVLGAPLA